MNKTKLLPIIILAALATAVIAAPGAEADVLSCATTGAAGPISPGHEALLSDLGRNGNDGLIGFGEPLTDTDNGIREPAPGWEDGLYEYHDWNALCLAVDANGPADDGSVDTGLYSAAIDSLGAYDNTICGTGLWIDRGPQDSTSVDLWPAVEVLVDPKEITGDEPFWVRSALGPGEDIVDANYRFTFAAGAGPIAISSATTFSGETLSGGGVAHITPVVGNCVTTNVTEFEVAAAFTVAGL